MLGLNLTKDFCKFSCSSEMMQKYLMVLLSDVQALEESRKKNKESSVKN